MDGPIQLMERYRLIAYPTDSAKGSQWLIFDCEEALEQNDPLAQARDLGAAIILAVKRLEDWIE